MSVRFVVDERSIDLNGLTSADGVNVIESLLERIEDACNDGHGVCFDDELFHIPLIKKRSFWDLCDPTSPVYLPPEVQERAAAVFGRMQRWYEVDGIQITGVDVSVDGAPAETSASVAWAHENAGATGLRSVACICAKGRRRPGALSVNLDGRSKIIWFIEGARDMENYFRWLIAQFATTPDEISALASAAFKNLLFVDRCFDGIRFMSKACHQLAPEIVAHLSAFSDEGQRIFSGPRKSAPAMFGALGVTISDENGGTKRNSKAKKERTRIFGGEEFVFWWHSKIEPHQDRIHIYPNKVTKGGKIIVGIFCQHLTV